MVPSAAKPYSICIKSAWALRIKSAQDTTTADSRIRSRLRLLFGSTVALPPRTFLPKIDHAETSDASLHYPGNSSAGCAESVLRRQRRAAPETAVHLCR